MRAFRIGAFAAMALAVPAFVLAAEPKRDPAPASSARRDSLNIAGRSEAMDAIVEGNAKYVAKDYLSAIDLYKKAIKLQPRNALAHYLLAESQLATGSMGEADAELHQADEVGDATPAVKARVLFAIADLRERQKKWDDAKAAWQRYTDYASQHDAGAYPATAAARQTALDEMLKQEKAYEVVRQRIADEKDAAANPPPSAKPDAAKKK